MTSDRLAFLRAAFEDNYEYLKLESGHTISPALKEMAWQQVEMYWNKLRHIAEKITETEVKLTLPDQRTPQDRRYTIEGVVDIVREADRVVMYDLKTHEAEQVRENKAHYARQLNVYAYIWKQLRGQQLDGTAIIATAIPKALREALDSEEAGNSGPLMDAWDPIVPMEYDSRAVEECIDAFGAVVDQIESGAFRPRTVAELQTKFPGAKAAFGVAVCRYCDARFSCDAYRDFVKAGNPSLKGYAMMQYYLEDYGDEEEQSDWLAALIEEEDSDIN